jgi:hypothetical protein
VVVHIYNPSTWEFGAADGKFQVSQGYVVRSCLYKEKKKKKKERKKKEKK